MDDLVPEPLRIVKSAPVRKREYTGISALSYPRIPRRTSSVRGDWRQRSDGSENSIITPPLSVSMEQLEIPKMRSAEKKTRKDGGLRCETKVTDYPIDEKQPDTQSVNMPVKAAVQVEQKGLPRLANMVSFGSWGSIMRRLSMDATSKLINRRSVDYSGKCPTDGEIGMKPDKKRHTGTSLVPVRRVSTAHKADPIAPGSFPITGAKMKITTLNPPIGVEPILVWATVEVTADVGSDEPVNSGWLAPLDVVIVLDSVPQAAIGRLRQTAISSLAVVSNLVNGMDHFAITYIDHHAVNDVRILLPLGSHTMDSARTAIETFTIRQLTAEKSEEGELHNALPQLSKMLCFSQRMALRHIFFITAASPMYVTTPMIENEIGFHTISPDYCFSFDNPAVPRGSHIFYDIHRNHSDSQERLLKRKVFKVIEYLRTGLDPGAVADLRLNLIAGEGCRLQSILEESQLAMLRPGEKWVVPIQVSVPAASLKQALGTPEKLTWGDNLPALDMLMDQLQDLMRDFSHGDIVQHIMTARLEYRHSLLPPHSTVCLESHCTVSRDANGISAVSWDLLQEP